MDRMGVDTSDDTPLSTYLKALARRRGYDIDAPRGGDKGRLADDAGISRTTLSRTLNEGRTPDTRALAGLAKALDVDLQVFLVEGGVIPPELASRPIPSPSVRTNSLDAIADELNATSTERSILASMVASLIESMRHANVQAVPRRPTAEAETPGFEHPPDHARD